MYEIVRFYFGQKSKVIKHNVTLEEAKKHCNNPSTKGENWYDGWRKIKEKK